MLIDSHCHLDFPDFTEDFADMLTRAKGNGVQQLLTISTQAKDFDKIIGIAETHNHIYASIGIHPHNADAPENDLSTDDLLRLTAHPRVIGLGETGLDYYYDHADRTKQQELFSRHIVASQENGLPVIVHSRDAEDDTLQILSDHYHDKPFPILIHCFTASRAFADKVLDLGGYISISGIVTFKNAKDLQKTVRNVPLTRLLVETDAPYLAPMPHRGKRNEPAFVKHTAAFVADLKNVSFEEVATTTTQNFYDLFKKAAA